MNWNWKLVTSLAICLIFLTFGRTSRKAHAEHPMVAKSERNELKVRHPFVTTIVNVFVNQSTMTVRVSSSADELDLIHGIVADEVTGMYDATELREGVDIHGEFLLEHFEIYDAAGDRVRGRIVERPEWTVPDEGLTTGRLLEFMLDYVFEYEYNTPEPPEYLTFQSSIDDPNSTVPSEMDMVVRQAGTDSPFRALVKVRRPETIRFDWDNPPQRQMTGDELKEYFELTREKTLGLTDYGGTYSFLYITHREIRHEILVPLATLKPLVRFKHKDTYYVTVEEQAEARKKIEEFFKEHIPVKVNGNRVEPRFDRIDFAGMDVRDFAMVINKKKVALANARVGIVMSFPIRNIPDKVELVWDKFSREMNEVDVVMIEPDDKVQRKQFSRFLETNELAWDNEDIPPLPDVVDVVDTVERKPRERKIPAWYWLGWCVVPIMLVGSRLGTGSGSAMKSFLVAGGIMSGIVMAVLPLVFTDAFLTDGDPIPETQATEVFAQLHTNLFRAFDYHTEEAVYDALAQTTDGPMLKKIYLDMRRSLEVKEQGGAVSNIDRIEIMEGEVSNEPVGGSRLFHPDFTYRCVWELEGTVEHFGHIHRRTNRYEALFNVRGLDGFWKFTEFQPIDEQQGPVIRSVRKF